jgi:hypothetical protein
MRRWQYKVVEQKVLSTGGRAEFEESPSRGAMLERYGSEGWELVAVTQQAFRREYDSTSMQGYAYVSYFFKREELAAP